MKKFWGIYFVWAILEFLARKMKTILFFLENSLCWFYLLRNFCGMCWPDFFIVDQNRNKAIECSELRMFWGNWTFNANSVLILPRSKLWRSAELVLGSNISWNYLCMHWSFRQLHCSSFSWPFLFASPPWNTLLFFFIFLLSQF